MERIRILNLLSDGPLCVCHLFEILESDQVKVSKQLRYMKTLGVVQGKRVAQWMVYRLARPGDPLLQSNISNLKKYYDKNGVLSEDDQKLKRLLRRLKKEKPICAEAIEEPRKAHR